MAHKGYCTGALKFANFGKPLTHMLARIGRKTREIGLIAARSENDEEEAIFRQINYNLWQTIPTWRMLGLFAGKTIL